MQVPAEIATAASPRPTGIPAVDIDTIRKTLEEGKQAFIVTKTSAKEEVILDGTELKIKSTNAPVVNIDKFVLEHQVTCTSNWYKLISAHGPPSLHMGPIAYFMDKTLRVPIMYNTITDTIVETQIPVGTQTASA